MSNTWDIYRAVGDPPSFGGTAELVPGIRLDSTEAAPVVSDDELEIFFASNRKDPSLGYVLDIWTATRASAADPFDPPTLVDALSTAGPNNDWPVSLSPDGCNLYYINKVSGVATLFVATR